VTARARRSPGRNRGSRPVRAAKRDHHQATKPLTATSIKRDELRARFPRLVERIDDTIGELASDERLVGCAHLERARYVAACVVHPAAGPMCLHCAVDHAGRHTFDVEHTCDQCGSLSVNLRALVSHAVSAGLSIRDRRGRELRVFGKIQLFGLGVCDRCYEDQAA
jgi:hypothetical protein